MKKKKEENHVLGLFPIEAIERHIYAIRGRKVMIDRDLASLYAVKTIALRQQVKRNPERFPEDFMFQLSQKEIEVLVSQNVIPSLRSLGGYLPYAFSEQGIAMLSSVLKSRQAIAVNIVIMRTFTRLREMLASHIVLLRRLDELEKEQKEHGIKIEAVFEAIREMGQPQEKDSKNPMGFQ